MKLSSHEIARMIDASIVRPDVDEEGLEQFAEAVKKYRFIGAHVLPYFVSELNALLEGESDILIGTAVGFPSGAHRTDVKIFEAKQALADGCKELDIVINIGALKSGRFDYVGDEIKAIVEAAEERPVKVVLETHYLASEEIKRGCELSIKAGAAFVKTSTGWAETGATLENIRLIKSFVGEAIKIKASGGIRNLETLLEMYRLGASRFGINAQAASDIIDECNLTYGGVVEL